MWFWINFSPIGQAPPAVKKTTDPPNAKQATVEPEAKLEGLYDCDFVFKINDQMKFRGTSISRTYWRCERSRTRMLFYLST